VLFVPAVVVAACFVLMLAYGAFRMAQQTTYDGPRVLAVQCNYPQDNTGEKGASMQEFAEFHLKTTADVLERERSAGRRVDLAAWSETVMPPLNPEARAALRSTDVGDFVNDVFARVQDLARRFNVAIICGGHYETNFVRRGDRFIAEDSRNSAFLFEPTGLLSTERYDKIHLVPFGSSSRSSTRSRGSTASAVVRAAGFPLRAHARRTGSSDGVRNPRIGAAAAFRDADLFRGRRRCAGRADVPRRRRQHEAR
jgi:hypothetical protein